ncbi:Nucleoporin NUP133 [Rhizoctonia solani]|uniref:Nucleoporin NUP133 n=1 Tax=Rhizoctonia solani TaxID=456999 RepID=A0A0K6G9K3_9AGAM|nr:Nucleoporin NUP133 [Rhizoctonia solani]
MYNTGAAPEVTLHSLIDGTLTTVPPDDLDPVCNNLISNDTIQDPHNNPKWKWLPQDPNTAQPYNLNSFNFFEEIVMAVVNSQSPSERFESDLEFQATRESMSLGSRHDSSCPDGFFYLRNQQQSSSKFSWRDLIMPMVFRGTEDGRDRINGRSNVIEFMRLVMRNDPRRRFVHGLTCENTRVRLWYHDRCDVVGSREFDINKDWRYLVRIILSMLLAPPDRLGFDPDVELVPTDDLDAEPNYDITIRNSDTEEYTTYRTLKIVYDVGVDNTVGPGTRVWIVRKLVDGDLVGPRCILKDTWMHEDREPEHTVLKEIREAQPSYAQHFLTPIDYGLAYFSVIKPDNTHTTIRRTKFIPTKKVLVNSRTTSRKSPGALRATGFNGEYHGTMPNSRQEEYRDFRYLNKHPRRHYRIVFKEIGKPVHQLRKWTHVFIAIQGGWEGLYAMHICGYVHRDVSCGNILLVSGPSGKRGVIIDLEYAKYIDDVSSPHDVKTGTAQFMATEVAFVEHDRLYNVRPAESMLEPLPPFRHNPLHDVESIWWLCIWMMFYLIPAGEDTKIQAENYHKVFGSPVTKQKFFTAPEFHKRTIHLRGVASFVSTMANWLTALNNHYLKSYQKQDGSKFIRIHGDIIKASYMHGKGAIKIFVLAARHTHTGEYRSTHVANARAALSKDLPAAPEVYLASLTDAVLRVISSGELDSIYNEPLSNGSIELTKDGPRWKCLPVDPVAAKGVEYDIFKFLGTIFDTRPAWSSVHLSRPDGFIYLNKKPPQKQPNEKTKKEEQGQEQEQERGEAVTSENKWTNIVLPMEFKNQSNRDNEVDDNARLVWSMNHIMRTDARRRFVLGLTCENTKARLWYTDRCDTVGSEDFDINKDWKHLVRLFASIVLAPLEGLGFDPNIKLLNLPSDDPDAELNYDITINNSDTEDTTVYRTVKMVSDIGADCTDGRGTRVWMVQKLVDEKLVGPSYILKDLWMDEDRVEEHVILKEIRDAQPGSSQYFLTPVDHGFARVNAEIDDTHKTLRRTELIPSINILPIHPSWTASVGNGRNGQRPLNARHSFGPPSDPCTSRQERHRDCQNLSENPRQRYLIVFEEIGQPVYKLSVWTDVFITIIRAWKGLHAMHLCGYVHRDVSNGNILVVPASRRHSKRGVIMDLEYAKKVDDVSSPHEVKTGTTNFLASEVEFMDHYFLSDVREAYSDVNQNQKSRKNRCPHSVTTCYTIWSVPPGFVFG